MRASIDKRYELRAGDANAREVECLPQPRDIDRHDLRRWPQLRGHGLFEFRVSGIAADIAFVRLSGTGSKPTAEAAALAVSTATNRISQQLRRPMAVAGLTEKADLSRGSSRNWRSRWPSS